MQRWLRYWLTTRTKIRPTTLRSYDVHVERHLIPYLGRLRLSELTGRHITDMITAIGATRTGTGGHPPRRRCTGSAPPSGRRLTRPSVKACCATIRPGTSRCPHRGGRTP